MKTEAKISLSRAETFQDQDAVHEIFSELRKEDPVAWCPETEGGPGFWSITKYDDIQFVSKNPKIFSSDRVHGGITFPSQEARRLSKVHSVAKAPLFEHSDKWRLAKAKTDRLVSECEQIYTKLP